MKRLLSLLFVFFTLLISCSEDDTNSINDNDSSDSSDSNNDSSALDVADWSINTHSNEVDPNYTEVYENNNSVRRIDIIFNSADWSLMLENMSSLYGTFGQGGGGGGPGFAPENPILMQSDIVRFINVDDSEENKTYRIFMDFDFCI